MAFVHTQDTYRSILPREDGNGKIWLQAYAVASCTATYPKMLAIGYESSGGRFGYKANALFDVGAASTTMAAQIGHFYLGISKETVPSDSWGWFQIGGYVGTVGCDSGGITGTIGGMFNVTDASVANAGAAASITNSVNIGAFGICTASASATATHSMYLLGVPFVGST